MSIIGRMYLWIIAAHGMLSLSLLMSCDTLDERDLSTETQPSYVSPAYVDNGDGTITDTTANGIMWVKCAYGESGEATCSGSATKIPYSDAFTHCGDLSLAGFDDWRLPTIAELETLGFTGPDYSWFKDYSTLKDEYWFSSDLENDIFVKALKISDKSIYKTAIDSSITRYARCARAIQP